MAVWKWNRNDIVWRKNQVNPCGSGTAAILSGGRIKSPANSPRKPISRTGTTRNTNKPRLNNKQTHNKNTPVHYSVLMVSCTRTPYYATSGPRPVTTNLVLRMLTCHLHGGTRSSPVYYIVQNNLSKKNPTKTLHTGHENPPPTCTFLFVSRTKVLRSRNSPSSPSSSTGLLANVPAPNLPPNARSSTVVLHSAGSSTNARGISSAETRSFVLIS